jgi:D-alanyl-D-alanine dipeptidase
MSADAPAESEAHEFDYLEPAENQDELDAVEIEDNGEQLVDFLEFCNPEKLIFAPKHPVFDFPRVHLLRESVAHMICDAANALPAGLRLMIVEGYRPLETQNAMFVHALAEARKRFPNADESRIRMEAGRYSAPPDAITPPPHLTGGAVDLGLVDENGEQLDFSSPFDITDHNSAAMNARGLSKTAQRNREILRSVLEPTGLTNYADEWWHWSYGDNGWALRVGAPKAIYGKIGLPENVDWVI